MTIEVTLRDALTPAERFWFAPKGFISNEGLVVIPCDRAEFGEMLCLHYTSGNGKAVALQIPLSLVLAIANIDQAGSRQPPGFGSHHPEGSAPKS